MSLRLRALPATRLAIALFAAGLGLLFAAAGLRRQCGACWVKGRETASGHLGRGGGPRKTRSTALTQVPAMAAGGWALWLSRRAVFRATCDSIQE